MSRAAVRHERIEFSMRTCAHMTPNVSTKPRRLSDGSVPIADNSASRASLSDSGGAPH
jgi:hypothetical protein